MGKIYEIYHIYTPDTIERRQEKERIGVFLDYDKALAFVKENENPHISADVGSYRYECGEGRSVGTLVIKEYEEWAVSSDKMWWKYEEDATEELKRQRELYLGKKIDAVTKAIELLKRAKEVFAPFDLANRLTEKEFPNYVRELHKASVDAGIKVYFFDDTYDYNADGSIEKWNGHERWDYAPIKIPCDSGLYNGGYFYKYGNYNIDDDIADLYKYIADLETERG